MKKGKLTTKEKYIIQGMNNCGKTTEEIAKEIDRSEESVKNYIKNELETIIDHIVQAKIDTLENENAALKTELDTLKSPPPVKLNVKDSMINTSTSGRGGVSIMTQAASEQVDATKQINSKHVKRNSGNSIFKIK